MMKHLTPVKAIRAKCLDCCCGEPKRVRECSISSCTLWPYRMGKRPRREQAGRPLFSELDVTLRGRRHGEQSTMS